VPTLRFSIKEAPYVLLRLEHLYLYGSSRTAERTKKNADADELVK